MDNKFGKISRISACAALKDGRTILEDLSFTAPYKIMMPFEKEKIRSIDSFRQSISGHGKR